MKLSAPAQILCSQNALSTTAEQILSENDTRRQAIVQNLEASGGINVFIKEDNTAGPTTGFRLAPGESVTIYNKNAMWAEAASGTPTIGILEEWD
jgi:hypothetical protein